MTIGKVTHVFTNKRCVAIRIKEGQLNQGDLLKFTKGDASTGMPGVHDSLHKAGSIEIDNESVVSVEVGQECAVHIGSGELPPNNCDVMVVMIPERC
jgi:hypothetical protein